LFLVLAIVLLFVLPSPWNVVAALAGGAVFVLEIGFFQRRVRRHPVATGAENLVGAIGEVVEEGRVRVQGELWEARSDGELEPGTRVRVTAIDGLELHVEPADGA
jgi:membrane-bound serine protease (ClpP class)